MKTKFLIIIVVSSIGITVAVLSQIDLYDYNKHYAVFDDGSPLAEIGTGNAVLSKDNCHRYAHWLTEHQIEKLTLAEDYSVRYPPWGNQIFPLVDYCTDIGQLQKIVTDDSIKWKFQENEN